MHRTSLLAAVGLVLSLGTASAQDKTFELKLSHWVPPSHPLQKALEDWGASIEKDSGGTIKYKVFPSQQLGKAFDHYDMARDGIADFAYVNPGYQPGRFPVIAAGESAVPGRQRQGRPRGARRLVSQIRREGDEGRAGLLRLRARSRHVPFQRPRRSWCPADIKGMKIRPANATMACVRDAARRHQRAGLGAGSARHAGEGRRRRDHLPLGLDHAVRHRQGGEVPHGHAALRHRLRLGS